MVRAETGLTGLSCRKTASTAQFEYFRLVWPCDFFFRCCLMLSETLAVRRGRSYLGSSP